MHIVFVLHLQTQDPDVCC